MNDVELTYDELKVSYGERSGQFHKSFHFRHKCFECGKNTFFYLPEEALMKLIEEAKKKGFINGVS